MNDECEGDGNRPFPESKSSTHYITKIYLDEHLKLESHEKSRRPKKDLEF